jgi:diguanylate cyclase (GGDEF)-like protein/PAS domain S-box-containing protein
VSAAPTIRVLLTEDVAADAELEVRELRRAGLRFTHRVVDRQDSFEAALREFAPDVILSDFSMPGFDGMAALALARELAPDTPFVFVSGTIGEEYAIRALKNGATDYVLKNNLVRLPAAVERALADSRARREKRRAEAELEIARERLTSIFASLPDMLWSVDAHSGRIIYVSPAAQELFGHGADAFLHDERLRLEVVHPADRGRVKAAWEKLKQEGAFEIEYRAVRPDGSIRWVNNRGRRILGSDGGAERFDGLARDVTDQVHSRRRIERLSRIRELLGALSSAIVRTRERKALFDEFCRIAVSRGGFVLARIVEVDAAGKARLAASTEADPSQFQAMIDDYNADPIRARSLFAQAMRTGQPVMSNDLAEDARVRNRAELTRAGSYALALLPMLVDGRLDGLVALRRETGFFDEEEMRLLSEMVGNISFALELMDKEVRLRYLAYYDELTGMPNHALFHDNLTAVIASASESGSTMALMLADLERFKALNDALGRDKGDRVLQAVARRLHLAVGDLHRVARLGANTFAVMFPDVVHAEEAARRIEKDPARFFGLPFEIDGRELRLSVRAGVAVHPADGADAAVLFRNAEAALRRAKESGERCVFYTPQINARVSEQVELEHRLRRAVERGELHLHFQPKLELATRRIVGMEALMRWNAPDGVGPVSPAKFVPMLEQTGLILEAGRQAIAAASAAYRAWRAAGLAAPRIAVNLSALQLRRASFVADLRAALGDAAHDDGGGVDLEITESLLMTEVSDSIRKLREARDMGMRIALDDFGTGYSSLAYLSRLPVDTVKIDRGFVRGMSENAGDASIVAAIISLAHSLRLKVVAEGVESDEQAQRLGALGCDQAQGYLFSPPVPPARLEEMLKAL